MVSRKTEVAWSPSLCVCVCVRVCVRVCVCVCVCVRVSVSVSVSIYLSIYISVHIPKRALSQGDEEQTLFHDSLSKAL